MNISKKLLSVLTATFCAASVSVCSFSASAENVSAEKSDNGLYYVAVDEDEDGIYDFTRITGCSSSSTSLLIPKSIDDLVVREIADDAFADSTSLISIDVNSQNSYFSADDGVLFNKNGTKLIRYPSSKAATSYSIPSSVTEVADNAFAHCTKMEYVKIPDTVTKIGERAFYKCSSLGAGDSLNTFSIPKSVETIGDSAFWDTEILNYQIRNNGGPLYYADSWLIYVDSSVKTVMDASTPIKTGTTGIAGGAFSGCTGLTKVDMPYGVIYISEAAFANATKLSSVTIPASAKKIGEYAFAGCSSLVDLSIPNSVNSIGKYAFTNCKNLTEVNIPSSVTTIAESTFAYCTSLLEINIPVNVETIEKLAFYNCAELSKVTINNKSCDIKDVPQTFSNNETIFDGTIYGYEGSTAEKYAKAYNRLFVALGSGGDKPSISGDANGDGVTNVRDCAFIASALANGKGDTLPLAADFNEDGKTNVRDAAAIASYLASAK